MPYNDSQLFYAALYWAEALPGGEAFTDDICKKHGKPFTPMNAPKRGVKDDMDRDFNPFKKGEAERKATVIAKISEGVTQKECEAFFDAMYADLKSGNADTSYTSTGKDGQFFNLRRSTAYTSKKGYFSFHGSIEKGIEAANLDRDVLPRAVMHVQDSGQLFIYNSAAKKIEDFAYPGKPAQDFLSLPSITRDDLRHTPQVLLEYVYRIVDIVPGKSYDISYTAVDGTETSMPWEANEGDAFVISNSDTPDVEKLTDAQILSGKYGGIVTRREEYEAGFEHQVHRYTISATDKANIVTYHSDPHYCMPVTQKCQIGHGHRFRTAEPGDFIIASEQSGGAMVISAAEIKGGLVKLVPAPKKSSDGPAAAAPRQLQ